MIRPTDKPTTRPRHNQISDDKPRYFREIRAAIMEKRALSFVYERGDGGVVTHNAVYPRSLFRGIGRYYFRAYCHFPHDIRVFRLDRVRSLQVKPKSEPATNSPTTPPARTMVIRPTVLAGSVLALGVIFALLIPRIAPRAIDVKPESVGVGPGAQDAGLPKLQDCPVVGNAETGIYHAPGDAHYERMLQENRAGSDNRVCFQSSLEAEKAGHRRSKARGRKQ